MEQAGATNSSCAAHMDEQRPRTKANTVLTADQNLGRTGRNRVLACNTAHTPDTFEGIT